MIKNSITDTVTRLCVIKDCLPSDFYTESMNYRLLMELNEHLKRLTWADLAQWIGMGTITEEGRVISIIIVEHDARKFIDECVSSLQLQRRMLALVS